MSSYFGKNIHVSIFGQSHSDAIGVTIDNLPTGQAVDMTELQEFLNRRAPGRDNTATPRKESDIPNIICGLVNHVTCGAPLTAIIQNTNTRSQDYEHLRDHPRPSHADYTAQVKYNGFQDIRGGGHFSGRLTAPLCVAGGICLQILRREGIEIASHIHAIHGIKDIPFNPMGEDIDVLNALKSAPFPVLSSEIETKMRDAILEAQSQGDSVGGVVECIATGLPVGLGSPMFEGLESQFASILFGIPAVKGVEFGAGFSCATMFGSEHNDSFAVTNGQITTTTNHAGGILGGISSGMPLLFRVAFKPTPSISKEQQTISLSQMEQSSLSIHGRHDPCIVPRAVPVVEAVAAIVLLDALLDHK